MDLSFGVPPLVQQPVLLRQLERETGLEACTMQSPARRPTTRLSRTDKRRDARQTIN